MRCAKCFRWAHTFCAGMGEDFVCELVRDKHCNVLSLYPLYLYFFVFCNYSLCFLCKLFTSQNLEHVCLIWGDEAFMEMNFTPIFLFIMYDVYIATVSSLNA